MEEQLSLLSGLGTPAEKKKIDAVSPVIKLNKAVESARKSKRTIEEILNDSLRFLANDQCPRCGAFLDARKSKGEDIVFCSEIEDCSFEMPAKQVPIIIKRARAVND